MVDRTTFTMDRDSGHGCRAASLLNSLARADWEEYTAWCAGAPDEQEEDATQQETERDRQTALLLAMAQEKAKNDRQVALLIAMRPYLPAPGDSAEMLAFKTETIRDLYRQLNS